MTTNLTSVSRKASMDEPAADYSSAITFGTVRSDAFLNDPKSFLFALSRYRFASRMTIRCSSVLELGCSEGIGVSLLAPPRMRYTGVDIDRQALRVAENLWSGTACRFIKDDFLGKTYGTFDAVVCLDVIEHIDRSHEMSFTATLSGNLHDQGLAIVGTPNSTAAAYASKHSKAAHINLYSADRLKAVLSSVFNNVFIFGLNDEIVHTGFTPMAHYLMAIACNKKQNIPNNTYEQL